MIKFIKLNNYTFIETSDVVLIEILTKKKKRAVDEIRENR